MLCYFDENVSDHVKKEQLEKAHSIVACVNALAGIENPEEFVRKAKEVLNKEVSP